MTYLQQQQAQAAPQMVSQPSPIRATQQYNNTNFAPQTSNATTNPLADISVDFDAINRREKRMEKPTTSTVT